MSENSLKECSKCKENLEIIFFEFSKPGILRNKCKKCRYEEKKENLKNKRNKILKAQQSLKNKKCIQCNKTKNVSEFTKLINNSDGYCSYCKDCVKINRHKPSKKVNLEITEKRCIQCKLIKPLSNYRKSKDGYYYTCNNCWPEPEWNKEKQKASEKKYVENNKEKIREKWKKQSQNINRKIKNALNKRIKSYLTSKKMHTLEYTDCSVDFLKKWFEYNFEKDMTWDNYGKWHIDHITPCSKFDFTKETDIISCFNWKNLRPCWAIDNIIKGDKINKQLIDTFAKKALIFETQNPLLNE